MFLIKQIITLTWRQEGKILKSFYPEVFWPEYFGLCGLTAD